VGQVRFGKQQSIDNKATIVGNLGHYWSRVIAGINRLSGGEAGLRSQLVQLEQQILSLASNQQALNARQEHNRAEEERIRSELLRRIDALNHDCRENDISLARNGARLSECEQRITGLETGCSQERETVLALKGYVSETAHRLEVRNKQIKFLQDSARDQLKAFRTELAESSSRLESRDNETNHRLDQDHQSLLSLEGSLEDVLGRIDATDHDITALHQDIEEQRLRIESFLDSATAQLEVAGNHAGLLEKRLQTEFELTDKKLQQLKFQLQQQKTQLILMIAAVAVVLGLLVTVAILR
jgi:chromosome segregation ATPase